MSTALATQAKERRHHCRQQGCRNTYSEVLGGEMAFGKHYAGADCLPCYYAALMHNYGLTPERVRESEQLMTMFTEHLDKCGWAWADVEASFAREPHPVVM